MGWGPLAWERRPPANGPGPLACTAELSGLSHGRPRPWPWLSPCSCEGFGVPAQMQLGDFLCLFWLRSPRFSPRGQAVAGGGSIHLPPRHTPTPSQSQAPLRGLAASQGHQNAQNPDGCVVLSGTPQAQVCSCRPHPLPTTPRLGTLALLLLPPQTPPFYLPVPTEGLTMFVCSSALPAAHLRRPPADTSRMSVRLGPRPDSAPCRQLLWPPHPAVLSPVVGWRGSSLGFWGVRRFW